MNVYIDGACSNNGKPNAKAGYGVFFKHNDPRNEYKMVNGKQSNNTGELTAFIRSIEILENEKDIVHIYTDSEYVIKCATTYGSKLEKNNWKSSKENKTIPNLELLKKAYCLFKTKTNFKLHHIEAHTDNDDIHSLGNKEADKLACMAIGTDTENTNNDIIKLNWVTFDLKDEAKKYGAKWNVSKKCWYVDNTVSKENMEKLQLLKGNADDVTIEKPKSVTTDENKIYIKINFSKKDKAKALGARWDPNCKSWYYLNSIISDPNRTELRNLETS